MTFAAPGSMRITISSSIPCTSAQEPRSIAVDSMSVRVPDEFRRNRLNSSQSFRSFGGIFRETALPARRFLMLLLSVCANERIAERRRAD
jgi:hypothetical protein